MAFIVGDVTWQIIDQDLFQKHTGYQDLAEDRVYGHYWVSMYEAIVTEYAFEEVPKKIDEKITKKIMEDCNKYLADENLGWQ